MSDVTEADREKARELVVYADPDGIVERVARALAEEREKARAPFLALADEVDAYGVCMGSVVADEIRAAGCNAIRETP